LATQPLGRSSARGSRPLFANSGGFGGFDLLDLDANAKADLVWTGSGGQTVLWLMNGNALAAGGEVLRDPNFRVIGTGDFNADGRSDLIWYNESAKRTVIWLMNGGSIIGSGELSHNANEVVIAAPDFNGDAKSDLLWFNAASGQTVARLMDGVSVVSTSVLTTDPNFRVVALPDFDGDGRTDLVWYNASTGQSLAWRMNGSVRAAEVALLTHPQFKVLAAPDLNGDGKSDLIWNNAASGETVAWLMNGLVLAGGSNLLVNVNFKVVATLDANGDGNGDLLWRNPSTGQTVLWLMNGLNLVGGGPILTDPNFEVIGHADLNGDGKSDLQWYNASTGQTVSWLMNGGSILAAVTLLNDRNYRLAQGAGAPRDFASSFALCFTGTPSLYSTNYCNAFAAAFVSGSTADGANRIAAIANNSNVGNVGTGQPVSATGSPRPSLPALETAYRTAYNTCFVGTPALYTNTYCIGYAASIAANNTPAQANRIGATAAGSNVGNIGTGQPIDPVGVPGPTPGPAPTPTSFNLSGTLLVAPTARVDSDTNDASQVTQGNYRVNDTVASAQAVQAPLLLTGTVNEAFTGPQGNNYSVGDEDDYFAVDLVAGQVVELEFASDPGQTDVDLYVLSATGSSLGSSIGVSSRFECVRVTTTGRFIVNVYAYRRASIYNLRIGAPGSAGNCANSTRALSASASHLLARARPLPAAELASTSSRLQAAGITQARLVAQGPGVTDDEAVPHWLGLPASAEGRALALARLDGQSGAEARARRLSAVRGATASAGAEQALENALAQHKLAKSLEQTGAFVYVQPDRPATTQALVGEFPPNDRSYNLQRWHYEQINLPAAMSRITQLPSQPAQRPVVAVIDDGVMLDHPDLQPQLFSIGRAFITNAVAGDRNTASGDNTAVAADEPVFHGTHVAATVAAATFDGIGVAGTAPMAQILPLRVFPPDSGGARQVDILNAMLYAARLTNNSGTLPARRADVINLSLGADGACDAAYQDAVNRVRAAGVVVVAAAGNSGRNDIGQRVAVGTPANCTGVIGVAALNAQKQLARYSNSGSALAVAAPGGDLRQSSTGSGAPDGVFSALGAFDGAGRRLASSGPYQGTSMASPHVAGVVALMRYVNPSISVTQVDSLLASGALTDDLGTVGRDVDTGFGLINAGKAVAAALGALSTPPPAAPAGRVVASPSSIDFGSFQTTATLELALSAAGTETVVSVTSDDARVTVSATSVNGITRLGRYTVNVNRAGLAPGSYFPRLTVNLNPARSFTVQLSISQPAAGGSAAAGGDLGPLYVLLINPADGAVVRSILATRGTSGYTWSANGWALPRVQIIAGGDLDNDTLICQRGEACGAFPVLPAGRDLTTITLTGNRSDLAIEVAPLAGISPQSLGSQSPVRPRGAGEAPVRVGRPPPEAADRR
jgi:serine protease